MTEDELMLSYYDRVRETIAGLDAMVVDVLTKGATVILAVLVAPWSIFKNELPQASLGGAAENLAKIADWRALFVISVFALFAALYIIVAVSLYADLLSKAVAVGSELERTKLNVIPESCRLSTKLEQNPLAGGRNGTILYLVFASILYLGTAATSTFYLFEWSNSEGWSLAALSGLIIILIIVLAALCYSRVINVCPQRG